MQSRDNPPGDTPPLEVGETPTSTSAKKPLLRREAMLIATDRQRGAILAAVCSLAGVGMGFGLSQMAATNSNCQHQVHVERERATMPPPSTYEIVPTYTWLGVEGHSARFQDSEQQFTTGAIVTKVVPGSPAARAGLEAGSLITGVEGMRVMSFSKLVSIVRAHEKGERIVVNYVDPSQVWKIEDAQQVNVELGEITKRQLRAMTRSLR